MVSLVKQDDDLHPWLRGLDERQLAELAVELTDAICRPSFGSLTKRELEQTLFKLLYKHRADDWRNLGDIAEDLAISRTRARSLVQEYRNRSIGSAPRGQRLQLLREEVLSWSRRSVERDNERLRVVIDDPFLRDLLKNFAYGRGILVDQSLSSEIQSFTWHTYGQLLDALWEDQGGADEDAIRMFGAELRLQLRAAEFADALNEGELRKLLAEVDKDVDKLVNTPAERRWRTAKEAGTKYGPTAMGAAFKLLEGV